MTEHHGQVFYFIRIFCWSHIPPFPSYLQTRNRADPSRTCPPGVCRQVCWRLIGFSVYRLPGQKSGSTVAAADGATAPPWAQQHFLVPAHTEHKAGPPRASAVIQLVNFFIVLKWANYETREMRNETTKTRFTRPGERVLWCGKGGICYKLLLHGLRFMIRAQRAAWLVFLMKMGQNKMFVGLAGDSKRKDGSATAVNSFLSFR